MTSQNVYRARAVPTAGTFTLCSDAACTADQAITAGGAVRQIFVLLLAGTVGLEQLEVVRTRVGHSVSKAVGQLPYVGNPVGHVRHQGGVGETVAGGPHRVGGRHN